MAAKRALSVDAILKRRAEEDEALRAGVAELDIEIDQLKQKRAALVKALGGGEGVNAYVGKEEAPSTPEPARPQRHTCADCGARVVATEGEGECPACGAEPFEAAIADPA